MKLKDKSAIISGAASGIGKEIALIFAREGAKIAIADMNKTAADATAAKSKPTATAIGAMMDVTDEKVATASRRS
jgi:3-hydroxybutyrate dehydrogenase